MIIDATCAPADIRYPTDLSLLNEAREKTEKIIDILHKPLKGKIKKVRTYRQKARREYLKVAKKRRPSKKIIRKAIGKQLRYIRRNLRYIQELSEVSSLSLLTNKQYQDLQVIKKLYEQQLYMYENKVNSVKKRIVSISQPHVRPIVRGKAGSPVEFGAKISLSAVDGFVFLDRLSWESYNEAGDMIRQIELYKKRFGYYPESVHVDKIYRNRLNRAYCKDHEIRLSGPPLGRPKKVDKDQQKQTKEDELARIPIEGKIGNGKRRYGLNRIMAKLEETSETTIATIILVMNMEKILRDFLLLIFLLYKNRLFFIKYKN